MSKKISKFQKLKNKKKLNMIIKKMIQRKKK